MKRRGLRHRVTPLGALLVVAVLVSLAIAINALGAGGTQVCVPSKEGKPIVTPKGGVCKPGYALKELGNEGPAGGDLAGSYPNPTVKQASGAFSSTGAITANSSNATACSIVIANQTCFADEQNGALNVKNASNSAYENVYANSFFNVSSARLKKDIRPITPADLIGLLGTLERLPLYTFRYKQEPSGVSAHTGVIAEHSPALILAPDRKSVNLYDYLGLVAGATKAMATSMVAQQRQLGVQQREIDRLAKEVATLEHHARR
jgi:hypothetical protein